MTTSSPNAISQPMLLQTLKVAKAKWRKSIHRLLLESVLLVVVVVMSVRISES